MSSTSLSRSRSPSPVVCRFSRLLHHEDSPLVADAHFAIDDNISGNKKTRAMNRQRPRPLTINGAQSFISSSVPASPGFARSLVESRDESQSQSQSQSPSPRSAASREEQTQAAWFTADTETNSPHTPMADGRDDDSDDESEDRSKRGTAGWIRRPSLMAGLLANEDSLITSDDVKPFTLSASMPCSPRLCASPAESAKEAQQQEHSKQAAIAIGSACSVESAPVVLDSAPALFPDSFTAPAPVALYPVASDALYFVRQFPALFPSQTESTNPIISLILRVFIVPMCNVTYVNIIYQMYLNEIFHQRAITRWSHYICMPAVNLMIIMIIMAAIGEGGEGTNYWISVSYTVCLWACYALWGLISSLPTMGALMVPPMVALYSLAYFLHSFTLARWSLSSSAALFCVYLPVYFFLGFLQAVGHAFEDRMPPRMYEAQQSWMSYQTFFKLVERKSKFGAFYYRYLASDEARARFVSCVDAECGVAEAEEPMAILPFLWSIPARAGFIWLLYFMMACLLQLIFGMVAELIASPKLLPILVMKGIVNARTAMDEYQQQLQEQFNIKDYICHAVLRAFRVYWLLGYSSRQFSLLRSISSLAISSGDPAIDFIGVGGCASVKELPQFAQPEDTDKLKYFESSLTEPLSYSASPFLPCLRADGAATPLVIQRPADVALIVGDYVKQIKNKLIA